MPRNSRIIVPQTPHHVTQRGNMRRNVFFSRADRMFYLEHLLHYCRKFGVEIASYCLMNNHVHLILIPEEGDSISRALRPLHMRHSQRLNRREETTGLRWQGRFFSTPLDDIHAFYAFKYVALNPVRAGMVDNPVDYDWSSARTHFFNEANPFLTTRGKWRKIAGSAVQEAVNEGLSELDTEMFDIIRRNTPMNIATGEDEFVEQVEQSTGRACAFKSRGRPGKGSRPL